MIIKVKDQIEREIEITFPSYWSDNEYSSLKRYLYFLNENQGIVIMEGATQTYVPKYIKDWKHLKEATNEQISEMKEWFIYNQQHHNMIMNAITVDLNSNTPTEVLENLVKFESKADYSIDLRHNDKQDII